MILINGVDCILAKCYFEDEMHPINITEKHGLSKSNTKFQRRTENLFKIPCSNLLWIQMMPPNSPIKKLENILLIAPAVTFQEIVG